MDKKTILLTLKNIKNVGNVTARRIMDSLPTVEVDLDCLWRILQCFPKIKIDGFQVVENAYTESKKLLGRLDGSDVGMITYLDSEYPKSFLDISDFPVVLFYSGNIDLLSKKCVAIVGARKASSLGRKVSYDLAKKLCKDNIIVSGLAEGIDTEAHKSAINNDGKTIAILGHGLDVVYPPQNKELSRQIVEKGGLVISEYPFGQRHSKYTFVARNRLQSAISDEVYIVEAEEKSGTMHTAKKAKEYGKNLLVFKPKDSEKILPSGNRKLITEGATTFNEDCF